MLHRIITTRNKHNVSKRRIVCSHNNCFNKVLSIWSTGNDLDLYSGRARFESWLIHWLPSPTPLALQPRGPWPFFQFHGHFSDGRTPMLACHLYCFPHGQLTPTPWKQKTDVLPKRRLTSIRPYSVTSQNMATFFF